MPPPLSGNRPPRETNASALLAQLPRRADRRMGVPLRIDLAQDGIRDREGTRSRALGQPTSETNQLESGAVLQSQFEFSYCDGAALVCAFNTASRIVDFHRPTRPPRDSGASRAPRTMRQLRLQPPRHSRALPGGRGGALRARP